MSFERSQSFLDFEVLVERDNVGACSPRIHEPRSQGAVQEPSLTLPNPRSRRLDSGVIQPQKSAKGICALLPYGSSSVSGHLAVRHDPYHDLLDGVRLPVEDVDAVYPIHVRPQFIEVRGTDPESLTAGEEATVKRWEERTSAPLAFSLRPRSAST